MNWAGQNLRTSPARPLSDWLLAAIVLLAPLFMGGRQATGRLVLVALCGSLAMVWFWQQSRASRGNASRAWRLSKLHVLWLCGVLLVAIQMAPLGPEFRAHLSPHVDRVLPLWNTTAGQSLGFDPWSTVSLTPLETHRGLVLLVAYGLLFTVVLQRLDSWDAIRSLLQLVAVAGAVVALIALAQRFVGNGKFLWIYEHPYRLGNDAVKGPFTNQNHLGGFLTLTLTPWITLWCFRDTDPRPPWERPGGMPVDVQPSSFDLAAWAPLAIGLVICTALMTFSRGVFLALSVTTVAFCCLAWREIKAKQLQGLLAVLGVVAFALVVYGAEPLRRKLDTFSTSLQEMSSARAALWTALGKAIPHYLWAGSGVGSHREVYPQYMPESFGVELTHGENGYLQLLLETGIPGLTLWLVGCLVVIGCAWKVYRRAELAEHRAVGMVVLATFLGSFVHSLGDFVWYIPAYTTLLVVLAAAAVRGAQLVGNHSATVESNDSRRLGRRHWQMLASCAAIVLFWTTVVSLPPVLAGPHWDDYLRLSLDANKRKTEAMDLPLLKTLQQHLRQAVAADPQRARPQLRLASIQLKLFEQLQLESENPMPLAHLRSAAEDSRDAFGNIRAQQDWLERAVGENLENAREALDCAKAALRACPLQGDAYILVAELEMLVSLETHREKLLQQALRVRPYSGSVLFAVGTHFAFKNEPERATKYWRAAFHLQPEVRAVLVRMLAPQIPAADLLQSMRPTNDMLESIRREYAAQKRTDDAQFVAAQMAAIAERDARNGDAQKWQPAQHAWALAGHHPRSAFCGLEAVKSSPASYEVHWQLARSLRATGHHQQALHHARWCRQRRPQDESVAALCDQLAPRR